MIVVARTVVVAAGTTVARMIVESRKVVVAAGATVGCSDLLDQTTVVEDTDSMTFPWRTAHPSEQSESDYEQKSKTKNTKVFR